VISSIMGVSPVCRWPAVRADDIPAIVGVTRDGMMNRPWVVAAVVFSLWGYAK